MKFDKNKPFQTRDGRKARLLGELNPAANSCRVLVAVMTAEGFEEVVHYDDTGRYLPNFKEHPTDLINIPERFEYKRWVNVYRDQSVGDAFPYREDADRHALSNRIACVEVTISGNVGDGLE